MTAPLIEARRLTKRFPVRGRAAAFVTAVHEVSFAVERGEVLGLVGESGSGKTTLGRLVLRLEEPTSGTVLHRGEDITRLAGAALRSRRRHLQIVFQDPYSSLNPRMTAGRIIGEALRIHSMSDEVAELLRRVGLSADDANRYPHEFSGGQRQRIGIARALAVKPEFLVADEPVSALDVSIQAQVVNLLQDLKEEFGLAMLFIAHDLAVVEHVSDRVMVMYLGRIVESAPADELYANPVHPYTEALLSTVRPKGGRRMSLAGEIPSPINPPSGCVFHTRCPIATEECKKVVPPLVESSPGHFSGCLRRP